MVSLALATGSAARAGGAVPALFYSFPDEKVLAVQHGRARSRRAAARIDARLLQCTSPPDTAKAGPFMREVRMVGRKGDGVATVARRALRAWPMSDRLCQGGLQSIRVMSFCPWSSRTGGASRCGWQ